MPSFFNDGYTFKAGINPIEMVHDGIEIVFRPSAPSDTADFLAETDGKTGTDLRRVHAKHLLRKVIKWDFKQAGATKGQHPPELNESILVGDGAMKIHSALLSRMISIVIWGDKPDYGDECNLEELSKN